jgi:hypothetical protein
MDTQDALHVALAWANEDEQVINAQKDKMAKEHQLLT